MHKKSLEMSKKGSSPAESDSTRCNSFCDASERRGGGNTREEAHEEELLEMEEEDMEEEVAIDLSSSSKQQQQEAGGSVRSASSPRQQSGGESDEHSWRLEEESRRQCDSSVGITGIWLAHPSGITRIATTAITSFVTMQVIT